jgi:hypothetical protein
MKTKKPLFATEVMKLNKLRVKKCLSLYRISKDLDIAYTVTWRFFSLKIVPSMENYLLIKEYLESYISDQDVKEKQWTYRPPHLASCR